ncbi:MAG: exosome complex protein Rrp4 [Methanobacterium sp.]|nr:exosome complex protein Rrp4 [Methanobacterium sp.]
MIFVEDKDLVVPGDVLADEEYHTGRGTFKDESNICSSLVGLVAIREKKISVIPLQSKYIPKRGDVVIGEVTDIRFSMWNLDINSPYSGFLPASDVFGREKRELSNAFDVGDVLFLRVVDVDEVKKVKLGLKGRGLGKFRGGILIYITPTKVPRLIGKKGSMINMIKDETKCDIIVGQNGVVWVKGEPQMERVAEKVINMIEEQAHTSGLTDRVRHMLSELLGKEIEEEAEEDENEVPEPNTEE